MRKNGLLSLVYHAFFIAFILAPLVVVVLVSFTGKGYISLPTDGFSLRWFRAIGSATEFVNAFWLSLWLWCSPCPQRSPWCASGFRAAAC